MPCILRSLGYTKPDDSRSFRTPYDLASINKVIEVMTRTEDVRPRDVMAGQRTLEANDDESALSFDLGGTNVDTGSAATASNALAGQLPNRNLRIALLLNVLKNRFEQMPSVQQEIVDRLEVVLQGIQVTPTEDRNNDEIAGWERMLDGIIADLRNEKSAAYRDLDDETRSERAAGVGVNEHARPDIGESYGVLSSRDRNQQEQGNLWSFHFAAVIARDGDDSVTLENYNRGNGGAGNDSWYFDMHGAREQSFHEKHKDTVADGVTLRFGAPATEEDKAELLQLLQARYGSSPMLMAWRLRVQRAQTRAELAAIQADALG